MEIRPLYQQEILPALHLVWDVFVTELAPGYTPEGVAEFQKFIKYDNISQLWQRGELLFFGAFEDAELCGVIAYQPNGHIRLFYVRKERQGQGIGRLLFQAVQHDCMYRLRTGRITVNAAPEAVPKYTHMGMQKTSEEQVLNGIRFVPMELLLYQADPGRQVKQEHKKSRKTIALAVIGIVALAAVLIGCGVITYQSLTKNSTFGDSRGNSDEEGSQNPGSSQNPGGSQNPESSQEENVNEDENGGSASIPEYMAKNLSYELEEETYSFSDDEKQSMVIEFNVTYPKLAGMKDEAMQKQINETLKETALQTVDEIYENPSDEIKERVISESSPVLIVYGEYKVCYASDNLLSVVYDDYSYQGSQEAYVQHLRTCNISLKDGTVYQVKDIVNLSNDFLEEWADEMRDEADNDQFLTELSRKQMKKALEGDSLDGVYVANFFLDADGIEIGFDLNYPEDDPNDQGYVWVTAPFDWDEIQEYATDSNFWKELD